MMLSSTMRLLSGLILSLATGQALAAPVLIQVQNVKTNTNPIRISLFANAQDWQNERTTQALRIDPAVLGTSSVLLDLPPGEYAFFLFHDLNNNRELERTWVGYPNEPYAFSNNFQLHMSRPTFNQLKFVVPAQGTTHKVILVDP